MNRTEIGAGRAGGATRRAFLFSTLRAGAALAAAPAIVPASALGRGGAVAPSERIVLAAIAPGGRGSYDLGVALQEADVQVVAVCDVQKSRRDAAKAAVDARYGNADCAAVIDFREVLARTDVDAVIMAPGDRWHTPMAVLAMRAGKDVFSEKPSTMNVEEGRRLAETAARYGRIFQTGTQRLSEEKFVLADELARTGRLGRVHTVFAHTLRFEMRTDWLPEQPLPAPEEVDWDLWLGPAPWRPYNAGYLLGCGAWLNHLDFGTGVAGWCSHTIAQCQSAIGALRTSAVAYEHPGNATADGFTCRYANGVKLVLKIDGWRGTCGVRYEGDEGWVSVADGYEAPDVSSPVLLADRARIFRDYLGRTHRPMNHIRDFLNGVRTRRAAIADAEVAHRTMTTSHAINASMLLGRNLTWDPVREEFPGDPEANRLRSRAVRAPWQT